MALREKFGALREVWRSGISLALTRKFGAHNEVWRSQGSLALPPKHGGHRQVMPRACRYPGGVPLAKQVIQVAWPARNSQRLSAYWYPAFLGQRYCFYFEDPCRTRFQGDCRNADPCHHPNVFFESQIGVATFEVAFQQPTRPLSR